MTDRPVTPEREQEIRDLDTRFCQYNAGCSCCSFRLPLLAEIDRLRAMRTEAETLLAYQAEEIDRLRADLATAREALEQIAEADLKTNVLTLNRIARDALNRIGEQ